MSRLTALTLGAALLLSTACQWQAPKTSLGDVDVESADRETLESEYIRLRGRTQQLEAASALDVTKRDAEIETQKELNRMLRLELEATKVDLDYLETQFISIEDRLTRRETRASAVAAIADAQLLYEKSLGATPPTAGPDILKDVERKLASAEIQMQRENYAAAAYYANRAMRILDQSARRNTAFFSEGGARVISASSANVREGPGPRHAIIARLAYGTILVEIEKKDEWVRVKTRDGIRGWVHATLLY